MAIKTFDIKTHSPYWYDFRTVGVPGMYDGGLGASEIGNVLGLNEKYRPTLMELYHYKVGSEQAPRTINEAMFHGIMQEDYIADLWQYYDGTPDGYIGNKMNGLIKRHCRKPEGYIVNDKYPWLFASLDRLMVKGGVKLIGRGDTMEVDCPLECKTIGHFAAQMWESGIPPSYIAQVNQQMLVSETEYCELAIFKDGRRFEVIPLERSAILCEQIIERSYVFWQKVLIGRKAYADKINAEAKGDYETVRKSEGIIQHNEPFPDDNEAYKEYLSERYIRETMEVEGTDEDFSLVNQLNVINSISKELDKRKSLIQNTLTYRFVETGAEKLMFGGSGYLKYKPKWTNQVKPKPSDDFAKEECDKLNLTGIFN